MKKNWELMASSTLYVLTPLTAMALLAALVFLIFWHVPTMRSIRAYEDSMDAVFNEAEDCSNRAFAAKNYSAVRPCYARWEQWYSVNEPPKPGWNWPWRTWREIPAKPSSGGPK